MRVEQLTFTRFIAAISIVIYHYGGDSFLFNNKFVSFIFEQANIGVSYFFVLSGFVMTIAYFNKPLFNNTRYWFNRIARIYPLYLFALLIIVISNLFSDLNLTDFLLNLTITQAWFPNKALTVNFPGWSLSVEMFFYLCFPILLLKLKRKPIKEIAFLVIPFWIVSQIIYLLLINNYISTPLYTIRDFYYHPILHLNEFLAGILAGAYFLKNKKTQKPNPITAILLLISLIIIVLMYSSNDNLHNGLMAFFFAPLIYFLSIDKSSISKLFSKPICVHLGNISYGIYILQVPVWLVLSNKKLEALLNTLNNNEDNTPSFLIKLSILICFSSISYKYIENPIRSLIKKRFT